MAPARPAHSLRVAAAALLLAAPGCAAGIRGGAPHAAAVPGFSADTFTREGLRSGASATEAGCRALPDGLWVEAGERRERLRYAAAGLDDGLVTAVATAPPAAATALIYIPGDPGGGAYAFNGGVPSVVQVSEHYEHSPASRRAAAETLSAALGGMPVVLMARPGMHGSSGDHARDRHTEAEVALLDAALTQLRQRHGLGELTVHGFSSGGAILANLLARRGDIRCAVITSAPLDLAQFYRRRDGVLPDHYATRAAGFADPIRTIADAVPRRSDTTVFVLGDRGDRNVPPAAWDAWVAAARRAGLHVVVEEIKGFERPELGGGERSSHHTTSRGFEVAQACASGMPPERIREALRADAPIVVPRGRQLDGAEIQAAFAGRRMNAIEWYPRVNVSSVWDADGTLHHFDLRRPERRIRDLRWGWRATCSAPRARAAARCSRTGGC
jgi:dienelactone hydrolase